MKPLRNLVEYLFLRTFQFLLGLLPRKTGLFVGGTIGMAMYYLGIYRFIINRNMDHVGLWDKKTRERIIRSLYCNIGRYTVDFLRPARPLPPYRLHNYEEFKPLLNEGKGTIVILAHLGNWELLTTVFGETTGKLHVVAKQMNNPLVDKWLLAKRDASSVTTIFSNQALRKMVSALKKDSIIAILIDQYMLNHGTPVPFLGKTAKTVTTVAGLTLKTGCNVISIKAIMDKNGTYDIKFYHVEQSNPLSALEDERLLQIQTSHNNELSRLITEHPEHWFGWFHRRFRGYANYKRLKKS